MKIYKPKIGDRVWLRVPTNGIICKVSKKYGYTIKIDGIKKGTTMSYFDIHEIDVIATPITSSV